MQAARTKPKAGQTKQNVVALGQIMQLRQGCQELINSAWRFYRDDWTELLNAVRTLR
jgi:hypothetical protein